MNPYDKFKNAIVINAIRDYRGVLSILSHKPYDCIAQIEKRSLLLFFYSEWFCVLTNIDPEYLIERIEEEVAA